MSHWVWQRNMSIKIITENKKARFQYEVLETHEAGLQLRGSEVKSLRLGHCQLKDSFVDFQNGEMYLLNTHIAKYFSSSYNNHEPERKRKLLMHRREIDKLFGFVREKGLTLIPLKLYFKKGKAKVQLGVVRGKKMRDKRETVKKRDMDRELQRAVRRS